MKFHAKRISFYVSYLSYCADLEYSSCDHAIFPEAICNFFSLWNQHLYFIRLSSITSKKQRMKVQNNEFHSWQASLLVCIYLVSSVWILSSIIQFAISSTYFTLRITKQSLYREISYYKFFVFKEPFEYLT